MLSLSSIASSPSLRTPRRLVRRKSRQISPVVPDQSDADAVTTKNTATRSQSQTPTKTKNPATPPPAAGSVSSHAPVSHRTLTPISINAMNGTRKAADSENTKISSSLNRDASPDPKAASKNTAMPHAALSNRTNGATPIAQSFLSDQSSIPRSVTAPAFRALSEENTHASQNLADMEDDGRGGSIPVGGASLGKSGRVIERLMHENDMLKRELQIERLRAEEARKDVSMAQGKVVQMQSEYDARLHEASVNKTLLKRRERQLADAKIQIDGEKQRADAAVERERTWHAAMESSEKESKELVEKATQHAAMMDGRYTVLTSHWKEQENMVESAVKKLGSDIAAMGRQRVQDLERMNSLQDICDQQSAMLQKLGGEKDSIMAAFEAYKAAQEELLKDIKAKAAAQERANDEAIREAQRVAGELRWALNVKKNVRGADEG